MGGVLNKMETIIKIKKVNNVMKKLLFLTILLSSMFLSSFVSADGDIGLVKQWNCIDLYNYCPTCSYINLTVIQYPNQTVSTMNLAMTKINKDYIYQFCGTGELGSYSYTTCGDKAGVLTCEDMDFEVTPSGFVWTNGLYFLLIALSIGIIVLGYYVEDAWIVVLGSFGMVLFGLMVLFYGIAGMKDSVYTWGIGLITLMLGGYFGLKGSLEKLDM